MTIKNLQVHIPVVMRLHASQASVHRVTVVLKILVCTSTLCWAVMNPAAPTEQKRLISLKITDTCYDPTYCRYECEGRDNNDKVVKLPDHKSAINLVDGTFR